MELKFFFDSYALIEILKANPRYQPYRPEVVTITFLNLVEVMNSVFLDFGEDGARAVHEQFRHFVQEVERETIIEAVKLKQRYQKRSLSYADCVGYAYARRHGLRFLTGDEGFKDLGDVEFVK